MTKIVLVHGFHMQKRFSLGGKERIEALEEAIREKFPDVEIVVPEYIERYKWGLFFTKKSISEYAGVVWSMTGKLDNETIIIGYSLGGLITRWMVEEMNFPAKAVILVGTPNKGIKYSLKEKLLLKIFRIRSLLEIEWDSKLTQWLNSNWPPFPYYCLAGKRDRRIAVDSAILTDRLGYYKDMVIINAGHSGLIPESREDIENSAIPAILEILKKEISA